MEDEKKTECVICQSNDWQNVDEFRLKPENMSLCKKCGFVSYPDRIKDTSKLKEFYKNEYREAPTVAAVFTGQRKLHYHNEFLSELIKQWKKEGFKPKVFEVGAAIGMFLKWIKDNIKDAEIAGSELNEPNVRIAKHGYGISLGNEFDDSKKYDLIASYKVAEHIPHIDKELRRYAECLSDRGLLYISVPIWFDMMSNFGAVGFTLEYYYHTNHINVWSRKLFETLLKKSGLEIVKQNHVFYDSTYLCKRNDDLMKVEPEYEDPIKILDCLDKIKKASLSFDDGKYQEAIALWQKFPDAWINSYEIKRQEWHKKGFDAILSQVIKPAKQACPDSHVLSMFCVDLCMRYNKWEEATKFLEEALQKKPCDPSALIALGACYRQMADQTQDQNEKLKFYVEAREVTKFLQQTSFEHAHQSISWIFSDNAKIPVDFEAPNAAALKAI